MNPILFFSEETSFQLPYPEKLQIWLQEVAKAEGKAITQLHFIFCSDAYLLQLNQHHLSHDTLTDVITFDYAEEASSLEGDIYISIDTVKANAATLHLPFYQELCRVIIHGMLHLIGYDDKENEARAQMRTQENQCLAMPSAQAYLSLTTAF